MNSLIILSITLSFLVTLLVMPFWIRKAKEFGLKGLDKNKPYKKEIAESGGIIMILGFTLGVLSYIAISTFYFNSLNKITEIFTILASILLVTNIALIDDLFGWKKGLSKSSRLIMIFIAAIPLMVINAGESTMMGIEFGLIYPLIFIPIGIVGTTATYNFLAGFNGLEAGQGIIILTGLSFATYITGNPWLSIISLCMVASLIAFYIFNKFPAKVFPGDVLTYPIGIMIAIIAIMGNIEKIAIFFFIPYIMEVCLKVRGKCEKESFANPNPDGSLELKYKHIYGLTHLSIYILKKFKKKVYEKEVVYLIHGFQLLVIIIGLLFLL
jgi:UDP-N-acetylglucosamine--dolichyl-phosphate N-acetylglucosaminephosphotransferase